MRVWRDIPSEQTCRSKLSNSAKLNHKVQRLLGDIRDYHAVKKDDLNNFLERIYCLRGIKKSVDNIFSFSAARMFSKSHISKQDAYYLKRKIAKRAATKTAYLRILFDYYQKHQDEVNDPEELVTKLRDSNRATEEAGKVIGSASSVYLERIDPGHRATWEIMWNEDGTPAGSSVFILWFDKVIKEGYNQPFLVFLEGHPQTLDEDTAKFTGRVYYGTTSKPSKYFCFLRIHKQGGSMQMGELDRGKLRWRPFDTTYVTRDMSEKGARTARPSLAYNQLRTKELVVGLHKGDAFEMNRFHHTSFTSGGFIRCAGMLGGNQQGQVVYVDNNSGHYKPPSANLYRLVKYLNKRHVFSNDAVVHDCADKTSPAYDDAGISVQDYLSHMAPTVVSTEPIQVVT